MANGDPQKPVDWRTIIYGAVVVLGAVIGTTGSNLVIKEKRVVTHDELQVEMDTLRLQMERLPPGDTRRRIESMERYLERTTDYERPTHEW